MEDKIELLLKTKSWSQLTSEEKELVINELGAKAVYESMQQINNFTGSEEIEPDPRRRKILRDHFRKIHQRPSIIRQAFAYKVPAYLMAIITVALLFPVWMLSQSSAGTKTIYAESKPVRDTVFIRAKADTVYINRVVYKTIYKERAAQNDLAVIPEEQKTEPVGVSMQEKQELEYLLVSGSE